MGYGARAKRSIDLCQRSRFAIPPANREKERVHDGAYRRAHVKHLPAAENVARATFCRMSTSVSIGGNSRLGSVEVLCCSKLSQGKATPVFHDQSFQFG